jgi:hypothetical protein
MKSKCNHPMELPFCLGKTLELLKKPKELDRNAETLNPKYMEFENCRRKV